MIGALNIAQTGLSASKYAVENVANNITNENTPGYKKRVVNFSEINNLSLTAGQGVGYDLARVTSEFLYGNLVTETSKFSYNEEVSQILENVEALFAETENSGFSANLNRYYQSVENLRSEPNNEIYQADLANNGKFLVESIQKIYEGIERIQLIKEEELKANVDKVNNILNDIGKINERISDYDEVSIDLLDKRDNLEAELSKYVDIEVTNFNNEYELKIAGQTAVRYSTNIRSISIDEEKTTQIDRFSLKDSNGIAYDGIKNDLVVVGGVETAVPKTFEDGDVITYTFNAQESVSVKLGEVNLDGDTITEDNLIRSLVLEINNNPEIRTNITAYNGNPIYDANNNLVDYGQDEYLVIIADDSGIEGKFDSRVSIESIDEITSEVERENIYKTELTSEEASEFNVLNIFGSEVNLSSGIIKAQIEYSDSTSPINKLQDFKDQLDTFANTLTDLGSAYYRNTISGEYVYGQKSADELAQSNLEPAKATIDMSALNFADINTIEIDYDGVVVTLDSSAIAAATTSEELATAIQNELNSEQGANVTVETKINGDIVINDPEFKLIDNTGFSVLDAAANPKVSSLDIDLEPKYEQSLSELNLFSGSDVKSLKFNTEVINSLDQNDLDYLASIQWKDDVSFDLKAQDPNDNDSVSFSEFYQSIRVSVSSEKESADFVLNTQAEVRQSLEATYESIVRVDKDEEMTALIQFQAAYTASAKVITVVDEMLQTLLGIKR